jgi:hypothetical protein
MDEFNRISKADVAASVAPRLGKIAFVEGRAHHEDLDHIVCNGHASFHLKSVDADTDRGVEPFLVSLP